MKKLRSWLFGLFQRIISGAPPRVIHLWQREGFALLWVRRLNKLLAPRYVTVVRIADVHLKGARLALRPLADNMFWLGTHEPDVNELLDNLVHPGMCVVDAGAYIGYFTIRMSRLVGEGGHVFAVEPNPSAWHLLERNLSLNAIRNATILPVALGEREGYAFIQDPDALSMSQVGPSGELRVQVQQLDGMQLPPIELLKVDIEGAEVNALRGFERGLQLRDVKLLVEIHSAELGSELTTFLHKLSYDYYFDIARGDWVTTVASGHYLICRERLSLPG